MKYVLRIRTLSIALGLSLLQATLAQDGLPPSKAPPEETPPPAAAKFLADVDAAEAIADPLQRCIAFPDLPGNHWVPGMVEAQCHFLFDPPRVTLDIIEDRLDRRDAAGIDAVFKKDLERHFSTKEFSEGIHADFDVFQDDGRSERLTRLWLEQEPRSPYALTARAMYFRRLGANARGTESGAQTAESSMTEMHQAFAQAVPLFQEALKIEPRLLPAHVGLISMATADGDEASSEQAIAAAHRIDPDCSQFFRFELEAREPRWGGTYEGMEALESTLGSRVQRRPLLGLYIGATAADRAEMTCSEGNYADAVLALRPIPLLTVRGDPYDCLAYSLAHQDVHAYAWSDLIALVANSRFHPDDADANTALGSALMEADQYDLSFKYLQRASKEHPEDGELHLSVASLLSFRHDIPGEQAELALAARDPKLAARASRQLATSLFLEHRLPEAKMQVDRLNHDYPDDALGWELHYNIYTALGDKAEGLNGLRTYLAKSNLSDPANQARIKFYEKILDDASKPAKPRSGIARVTSAMTAKPKAIAPIDGWVRASVDPDFLSAHLPAYPHDAQAEGTSGTVVLHVLVDRMGRPIAVGLEISTGDRRLDEAAATAAFQWKYVAASRDGIASPSLLSVPVEFRIGDDPPHTQFVRPEESAGFDGTHGADQAALTALEQEAAQGDRYIQELVGKLYASGVGRARDPVKAFDWFQKAALQGYDVAEVSIAMAYMKGEGAPKDPVREIEWLKKASADGSAIGAYIVAMNYSYGTGVAKDPVQAADWNRKAAVQGMPNAQWDLSKAYQKGEGVPSDDVLAHAWLSLALGTIDSPAIRDQMNTLAARMTAPQLDEAQRIAKGWTKGHDIAREH